MKPTEFDTLDLLHIMDAPVRASYVASRFNIKEDAAYGRLKRLAKQGLVACTKGEYRNYADGHAPNTYTLTRAGEEAYAGELARMDARRCTCDRPHYGKGLCKPCYQREYRPSRGKRTNAATAIAHARAS